VRTPSVPELLSSQSTAIWVFQGGPEIGAYLIRRLDAETFRRICMSFDAWVVGLIELNLIESP
jgi:hypothetical protein